MATPNLAGALLNWEQQGTGGVADGPARGRVAAAGDAAWRCRAGTWRSTRSAALLAAVRGRRGRRRRCSTGSPAFEGVRRRFESVGHRGGRARLRRLRPPSDRGARDARGAARGRGRRPLDRGVPAAPVLADRDLRPRVRAGAEPAPTRCSCSTSTPRASSRSPGSAVPASPSTSSVPVRYVPDFSAVADLVAASARPGDVVVTMGAGDVTLLGQEILAALQARARRDAVGRDRTDGQPTTRPDRDPVTSRATLTPSRTRPTPTMPTVAKPRPKREPDAADAPTSRDRGGGRGANARSGAPRRSGRRRSRTPGARPSARVDGPCGRRAETACARPDSGPQGADVVGAGQRASWSGSACCCTSRRSCRRASW